MSNKVCCNCAHCIRSRDTKYNIVVCRCKKYDRYLSYVEVMVGWCKAWKKENGRRVMKQTKTLYDFDSEFEELMDRALNDLSPKHFSKFLDDISMILTEYEDKAEGE